MDSSDKNRLEIDITNLREQRRPLWMSSLGIDHPADMIGGGGDVWTDRLTTEWPRYTGEEVLEDVAQGQEGVNAQAAEMKEFPRKSELTQTVEEAFRFVHSKEKQTGKQ